MQHQALAHSPEQSSPAAGFHWRKAALVKLPKRWTILSHVSPLATKYQLLQVSITPSWIGEGFGTAVGPEETVLLGVVSLTLTQYE